MVLAPYYAPTYFAASYFYGGSDPSAAPSPARPSHYNAPTYFPLTYFYGNSSSPTSPTSPMGLLPYNAPTYFPSAYFYGSSSAGSPVVPTPVPVPDPVPEPFPHPAPIGRDVDAYASLLASITATGLFEDVILGASSRRGLAGADTYPLAVLTPRSWEESDEVDPTSIVRRATFSITLVIKGQDELPEYEQLERLASAIKRAVDRSDLGGSSLPALTRIRSGRFEYSGHYPEQTLELEGEFSSIIDPTASS